MCFVNFSNVQWSCKKGITARYKAGKIWQNQIKSELEWDGDFCTLLRALCWCVQVAFAMEMEDNDPKSDLYNECFYAGDSREYIRLLNANKVRLFILRLSLSCCLKLFTDWSSSSETTTWCDGFQKREKWYHNGHCTSMVCAPFLLVYVDVLVTLIWDSDSGIVVLLLLLLYQVRRWIFRDSVRICQ